MPIKLPPDLTKLSVDELATLKLYCEKEIDNITAQINGARERGKVDKNWLKKAEAARRIYGRDCQRIQIEQGRRKRAQTASFERRFVDAAKRRLNEDVYQGIMNEALEV